MAGSVAATDATQARRGLDGRPHGKVRKRGLVLREIGDEPCGDPAARDDIVPEQRDAAAVRPGESYELADQRALAGAVRAEQSEHLTLVDVQVDAGVRVNGSVAVGLLDPAHAQCRLAHSSRVAYPVSPSRTAVDGVCT